MSNAFRVDLPTIITFGNADRQVADTQSVGKITKVEPNGELTIRLAPDVDSDIFDDDWLFAEVDMRIVPLRIDSSKQRGKTTLIVRLAHLSTAEELEILVGCNVLAKVDSDDDAEEDFSLIGYTILDTNGTTIGTIVDIDDRVSANPLFVAEATSGEELLIPAADEFVVGVDDENQLIILNLPEGLLNIDNAEEV